MKECNVQRTPPNPKVTLPYWRTRDATEHDVTVTQGEARPALTVAEKRRRVMVNGW